MHGHVFVMILCNSEEKAGRGCKYNKWSCCVFFVKSVYLKEINSLAVQARRTNGVVFSVKIFI